MNREWRLKGAWKRPDHRQIDELACYSRSRWQIRDEESRLWDGTIM